MLTSAKNPRVASAARLRRRAFRDEERRFLVEGAHFYTHALPRPLIHSRNTRDAHQCVAQLFESIARRLAHEAPAHAAVADVAVACPSLT